MAHIPSSSPPPVRNGRAFRFLFAGTVLALFLAITVANSTRVEAFRNRNGSLASPASSASSPAASRPVIRPLRTASSSSVSSSRSPASSTPNIGSLRAKLRAIGGKGFLNLVPFTKPTAPAAALVRPDTRMGTYLTYGSTGMEKFRLATMDGILEAGGNALVFEVKGGNVHFQTSAPMAQELKLVVPAYDLPAVIAQAKERGLYTIARYVAVKDPLFAERRPSARIKNPRTGGDASTTWVDPSAPDTLTYNEEILRDLLVSGIDEVNFDYIRYPTEHAQEAVGLTGQQKADRLEAFISMAKKLRDELSPSTRLGLSTYAILGWDFAINFEHLGQDIARFAPLVDVISPMAYPDSFADASYTPPKGYPRTRAYYLVYTTMKGYRKLLGEEESIKLRPWIQAYFLSPSEIRDEIDAVYDSGSCGFTFWSAGNKYANAYAGMKLALKDRPEQCKD